MRRWLTLLAVLLVLCGCARMPVPPTSNPASRPPAGKQATVPPGTGASQGPAREQPQPTAALPTVQRQPGHITVRGSAGIVQAALSPGAQQAAVVYGNGDPKQPAFALGILPVHTDGPVRELIRFPAAISSLGSPVLAGWLDDQRVVVVTRSLHSDGPATPDGGALRAEVWDTGSGQRTSASAWVTGMMGWLPQAWLAGGGDSARVLIKTSGLWSLDPVGGQAQRLVDDLPAIKNLGSFVSASPDGWYALYGGAMNRDRHGVANLHTGQDLPLPAAWRQIAWGATGHLLALTNTNEHPGQVLSYYELNWDFYGTVVVASDDGKMQRQLPLPSGLLATVAHETPAGWLVVETARLIKDATNKEFGYRVENGPLLTAGPTDARLRPLWDWPGPYLPGTPKPWLLAGNWLLVDHQQIPLAGGKPLPWPAGIQSVVPEPADSTRPSPLPVVVGDGSTFALFVPGQTQTYPVGNAAEHSVQQLEVARGWATVRFYGENSLSELHLVQVQ